MVSLDLLHFKEFSCITNYSNSINSFPDIEVRSLAVYWIRGISNDELVDYLPQLVQALKHETYETSSLAGFLLERALTSPRIAHHLYWLLIHTLPGQCPQVGFYLLFIKINYIIYICLILEFHLGQHVT